MERLAMARMGFLDKAREVEVSSLVAIPSRLDAELCCRVHNSLHKRQLGRTILCEERFPIARPGTPPSDREGMSWRGEAIRRIKSG